MYKNIIIYNNMSVITKHISNKCYYYNYSFTIYVYKCIIYKLNLGLK